MTSKPIANMPRGDWGSALGLFLLRLWLGARALVTGIEKYSGARSSDSAVLIDGAPNEYGLTESTAEKVYGLDYYHGIPDALAGTLQAEPLVPEVLFKAYNGALGPALLILGVTLLLGIAPRISLFLTGLLYTSLTVGLILLRQDAGVAWLAVHVLLVAVALIYSRYDRITLLARKW